MCTRSLTYLERKCTSFQSKLRLVIKNCYGFLLILKRILSVIVLTVKVN